MSAEPPPKIHPCRRLTTPDNEQVDIDTEMLPLVQTLWVMGLVTLACCQDIGESAAGLRDLERTAPSGHGGFVAYYRGYAWLKMPLNDGKILLNTLLETPFHDRVTIDGSRDPGGCTYPSSTARTTASTWPTPRRSTSPANRYQR